MVESKTGNNRKRVWWKGRGKGIRSKGLGVEFICRTKVQDRNPSSLGWVLSLTTSPTINDFPNNPFVKNLPPGLTFLSFEQLWTSFPQSLSSLPFRLGSGLGLPRTRTLCRSSLSTSSPLVPSFDLYSRFILVAGTFGSIPQMLSKTYLLNLPRLVSSPSYVLTSNSTYVCTYV